jgi:hypothetical protein
MSEKDKAHLAGWAIGILTAIALSVAGWALNSCNALESEQARQGQETKDLREMVTEVRQDVKELLRRQK